MEIILYPKTNIDEEIIQKEMYECCGIAYKIPQPYVIKNGSIVIKEVKNGNTVFTTVFSRPAFITAICRNIDTGDEKVELTLEKNNKKILVDKSMLYSKSKIIQLADKGMQVTSLNANHWIHFLSELEVLNEDIIPVKTTVNHLGWINSKTFIPYEKGNFDLDIDDDISIWTQALSEKGDLNTWIEKISKLRENPVFRFILATSFSAPLLKITNSRNFVVYNWGNSKRREISCSILCYVGLG